MLDAVAFMEGYLFAYLPTWKHTSASMPDKPGSVRAALPVTKQALLAGRWPLLGSWLAAPASGTG